MLLDYLRALGRRVELERLLGATVLSGERARPDHLMEAMRYVTLGGGKRVRPFLVVASADLFDVPRERALILGNLAEALAPYGVTEDMIPIAFNCFMNVPVDGRTGRLEVLPPISGPGDSVTFEAKMDLVIGMTACSAPASNGGSFKPIHYRVD